MSGKGLFEVHHGTIHKPGRRLMQAVAVPFVRRRVSGGGRRGMGAALNLTSMIDFLMVVVIFLLSTFSASSEASIPKEVKLPNAHNVDELLAAPMVGVVGKYSGTSLVSGDIYVENKAVSGGVNDAIAAMNAGQTVQPFVVTELSNRLKFMKDTWKQVHLGGDVFPGVVILQLDEKLPAFIVKSVFYTCALSGYPNISFLVNKTGKKSAEPSE